jgi:hypothetical protein
MALPHRRRATVGRGGAILASSCGKDRSRLGHRAAGRPERALVANRVAHDIKVYPQAMGSSVDLDR